MARQLHRARQTAGAGTKSRLRVGRARSAPRRGHRLCRRTGCPAARSTPQRSSGPRSYRPQARAPGDSLGVSAPGTGRPLAQTQRRSETASTVRRRRPRRRLSPARRPGQRGPNGVTVASGPDGASRRPVHGRQHSDSRRHLGDRGSRRHRVPRRIGWEPVQRSGRTPPVIGAPPSPTRPVTRRGSAPKPQARALNA